jgi:hypothetical protein
LSIAFLLSDFAHNGPDGFTATNAIANAANKSVPTVAKRTAEAKRFRLNECGFFILIEAELVELVECSVSQAKCTNVKPFNLAFS